MNTSLKFATSIVMFLISCCVFTAAVVASSWFLCSHEMLSRSMLWSCLWWIPAVWEKLLFAKALIIKKKKKKKKKKKRKKKKKKKRKKKKRKKKPALKELPDEILVEILSQVHAEFIVNECRRVCKHWNALTATPYFTKKHFLSHQRASASASIMVTYLEKGKLKVLLLNDNNHSDVMTPMIIKLSPDFPEEEENASCYTHGDLLLFKTYRPNRSFLICNPITREKVVLNTYDGHICEIFYHPFAMEYRVIWRRCSPLPDNLEFKILNLGPSTTNTTKQQPPSWRQLPNFDCWPRYHSRPVLLEEAAALHWIIGDNRAFREHGPLQQDSSPHPQCNDFIIVFHINKETFSTMPHPGEKCHMSSRRHNAMHLFELKREGGERGLLCLCDCSIKCRMEIWVLEDYENRVWVKRYTILFNPSFISYNVEHVKPFSLRNGILLIHWKHRGVVYIDMKNNNKEKEIRKILSDDVGFTSVNVFSMSLMPLCNHGGGSGGELCIINMPQQSWRVGVY